MKKIIYILAVITALSLAGCKDDSSSSEGKAKQTTVTVSASQSSSDGSSEKGKSADRGEENGFSDKETVKVTSGTAEKGGKETSEASGGTQKETKTSGAQKNETQTEQSSRENESDKVDNNTSDNGTVNNTVTEKGELPIMPIEPDDNTGTETKQTTKQTPGQTKKTSAAEEPGIVINDDGGIELPIVPIT